MGKLMANRRVANFKAVGYNDKKLFLDFKRANVVTLDVTGEVVYAYGGDAHTKRVGFPGERGGTLKVECQVQDFKLYQMITGANVDTTANFIEMQTATTTTEVPTITLTTEPLVGSTISVFATGNTDTLVPATFAGTTVTLTTPTPGTYDVYYTKPIATGVKKLNVKSSTFPKPYTIYMDTTYTTEQDEVLPVKYVLYKCQADPKYTVSYSSTGDPFSISMSFELLGDSDDNLYDMLVLDSAT